MDWAYPGVSAALVKLCSPATVTNIFKLRSSMYLPHAFIFKKSEWCHLKCQFHLFILTC
ncbi:hypothetical protein DCCM_2988 [Desulfocucumis palustris]|uniref:Uncharacterized protein n=1 Tax=Desulfocucumis palustris TaxID=1898651 RepID=A0A2L2XC22_9FIRM|nr:hypothetical protein DCCM_2988 [Desulfocucumis palustris]